MAEVFEVVQRWGDTILDVQYVREPPSTTKLGLVDVDVTKTTLPPPDLPYARGDDRRLLPYVGVALLVHLVVWGVATTTSPERDWSITLATKARPPLSHIVADDPKLDREDDDADEPGQTAMMLEDDHAAGTPESRAPIGRASVDKQQQIEAARSAGVLGANLDDGLKALAGTTSIASGVAEASFTNPDAATSYGLQFGVEGTQWGTVGVGDPGGVPRESLELPLIWFEIEICSTKEDCMNFGDLDPRVVRRKLLRKWRKLVRCWDGAPSYVVDFTIGRDGRVTQIHTTNECIAKVYTSIKFPRTRDIGTQVRHILKFHKRSTHTSLPTSDTR